MGDISGLRWLSSEIPQFNTGSTTLHDQNSELASVFRIEKPSIGLIFQDGVYQSLHPLGREGLSPLLPLLCELKRVPPREIKLTPNPGRCRRHWQCAPKPLDAALHAPHLQREVCPQPWATRR
jgi:hypothetical protein